MQKKQSPILVFLILLSVLALIGTACNASIPFIGNNHQNQPAMATIEQPLNPHTSVNTATATVNPYANYLKYRPVPDNGIVYYYDPTIWKLDESNSPYYHLVTLDDNCRIFDPTYNGHGLSGPANPSPVSIGGRNWIETYGYLFSYRNDLARIEIHDSSDDLSCQEKAFFVMASMQITGEVFIEETPMPTSTPQPLFVCPNAPNKLGFIGAGGFTTQTVRLRSSPEYLDNNTLVKLSPDTYFTILDGPVCGEYPGGEFVYWHVEIQNNDGSAMQGWIAEGDLENYYIEIEYGG
jgi:hypothetical protein